MRLKKNQVQEYCILFLFSWKRVLGKLCLNNIESDEAHFSIVKMSSNSKTPLTNPFASATVGYSRVVKNHFGDEESFGKGNLTFYNELPQRDDNLYYESISIPFLLQCPQWQLINIFCV
jgi:hypothetical protein